MTVWVTGVAGMLGSEVLRTLCSVPEVTVLSSDREVDITSRKAVAAFWSKAESGGNAVGDSIDWVVNCAAWTAVDAAEEKEDAAYTLNAVGPGVLAAEAASHGAGIVHISTDYVFDGTASSPYRPNDEPNPHSAYGRTKLAGEIGVRKANTRHVIIRTAWLYGAGGPNFVFTMLRLMKTREEIGVVADQRGVPTYAVDLASAIVSVVTTEEPTWGTYHFTNTASGFESHAGISWYDFAVAIQELGRREGLLDRTCGINALTTEQYPTPARRPGYSVLDTAEISRAFRVTVPDWQKSLHQFITSAFRYRDDLPNLAAAAVYDLETSEAMLKAARYIYVAYTSRQAVEKNLKVLIALRERTPRIHDLTALAHRAHLWLDEPAKRLLVELSDYYLKGRYQWDVDDLSSRLNREQATALFERSKEFCNRIRKHPAFSLF